MKNKNQSKVKKLFLKKEKLVSLNKTQLKSIYGGTGTGNITVHTATGPGGGAGYTSASNANC